MVIQRIQSLLLLLAAGLMAVVCVCLPLLQVDATHALYVYNFPTLLIVNCVCGGLLLIDIFLFKNLKLQILVAAICVALITAFIGLGALMVLLQDPEAVGTAWVWPAVVSAVAIVVTVWARACMKSDYSLLRNADRLR